MPNCSYCGRSFVDDNAVRMHNSAKHSFFLTCGKCEKGFKSQQALDQHMTDKHPSLFECRHCDREFTSEESRSQHEEAKHPPMFECEYCDKEFSTDEGRLAHEKAKHPPMFECEYCDKEFSSEEARRQHEDAKHPSTYECRHCDREFTSEESRTQHEEAKHPTFCNLCNRSFVSPQALQQHMETKKHIQRSECRSKFLTQNGLNAHKKVCHTYSSVTAAPIVPTIGRPSPALSFGVSNDVKSAWRIAAPASEPDQAETEAPGSVTPDFGAPDTNIEDLSASPDGFSTPEEGVHDGTAVEQSCACTICQRSSESCACTICQRASPPGLSKTIDPVGDDAGGAILADTVGLNDPAIAREVRCPACFDLIDANQGQHVCVPFESIIPLHCTACYAQFDDQSSLQEHLEEGRRSFVCQLCATSCCSSDMLQDHLLSHPGCVRCGKFFIDDPSLCKHVESTHPVVVCWDCDRAVVEQSSLELHYTESPAHPSCPYCEIGKRDSEDLEEHVNHDHPEVSDLNATPDGGFLADELGNQGGETGDVPNLSDGSDSLEIPPLSFPGEISLSILAMPPQSPQHHLDVPPSSSVVNGQEPLQLASHCDASPSPTPSEHGSNGSRSRVLMRNLEPSDNIALSDVSRPQSPATSILAESFSDISSPTSSSQSVVYVSAEGIPDYVRENRAYLVATSATSPSSGCAPLRLPSTSSLESLELRERHEPQVNTVPVANAPAPSTSAVRHRLHCRICMRDPCEDMTATLCGHIFCKRCITQSVVSKSECPVCKSATLLYCLFKLDLSA